MKRWSRIAIINAEPALARLDAVHRAESMDALERRHQTIQWLPTTIALGAAIAWIIAYGRLTDALEQTRFNVRNPAVVGETVYVLAMLMGMPFTITLAILIFGEVRRQLIRRAIRRHLDIPMCFWCGYALIGLPKRDETNLITCPECGKDSPTADSPSETTDKH